MTGLDLARELVLLGAKCALEAQSTGEVPHAWPGMPQRWDELGRRMSAHLDIPDAYQESLCASLGLSPTSYWLVMMCGAVEVFPDVAAAMGILSGEPALRLVTPVTFARLLPPALGVAFTRALSEAVTNATVERLGLVQRLRTDERTQPITHQPIRLTAGALKALLGSTLVEMGQTPSLSLHREEPSSGPGLAASVVSAAFGMLTERGMLCVRSASLRAGRQLALDLAGRQGENAYLVAATDSLPVAAELGRLRGALPVLDLYAWCQVHPFPEAYVREVGELLPLLVVVVPQNTTTCGLPTVVVDHLTWADSQRIWSLVLEGEPAAMTLAQRYRVNLEEARHAVRAARDVLRARGAVAHELDVDAIATQVLAQGAQRMDRWVTRLRTDWPLAALVVPKAVHDLLQEIAGWYQTSATVSQGWASQAAAGKGLSCLFLGQSGTGKTMAAHGLAAALKLNLYRVDLAAFLSHQHADMARLFDEAEAGHGVLLFDDLDAPLASSAHALMMAALLQRLESFEGISILVASSHAHLSPQMLRKLRFVVELPMPDRLRRRTIWEQCLPGSRSPEMNVEMLADVFAVSGGSIQNIALAAAHLAAHGDGILRPEHVVRAARRELIKVGLPHERQDFGPLGHLLTID